MSKKNNYYVLVLSNEGAMFVTHVDHKNQYSEWNKNEKPLKFHTKSGAEDIVYGLCLKGFHAFTISHPWEIVCQPYLYKKGHFEWIWDNENEGVN